MSDLVYRNGFSFMIGTGIGFGMSNGFRLLEESDKIPDDIEYSDSYPIGVAGMTEMANNYVEMGSGDTVFETFSDDPGFVAGTALGVYLGGKYFEASSRSDLEEVYNENGLEDIWNDLEY